MKWLTDRDREVYNYLLNNTRYVTTSQLTELFFKKSSIKNAKLICRRRMARLEKNLPDVQSFYMQANKDKIYTTCNPKDNCIAALSKIEHSLKLNDIYIQIRQHSEQHGHTIYYFGVEQTLKDGIIPDIILIYIIEKKARIFFIEYDRGTESLVRIKKKIENYQTYFSKQLYLSEEWQPASIKPELCFISDSLPRAIKIQKMGVTSYVDVRQLFGF